MMKKHSIPVAVLTAWIGIGSAVGQEGLIGHFDFKGGAVSAEAGACRLEETSKAKPAGEGLLLGKSAPAEIRLVIGKNIAPQGSLVMKIKPVGWKEDAWPLVSGEDGGWSWWLRKNDRVEKATGKGHTEEMLRLFMRKIDEDPRLSERAQRTAFNVAVDKGVADWPDEEWRSLAVVWKKGEYARMYVDGELTGGSGPESNWPPEKLQQMVFRGGYKSADTVLQELRVYDRPLSENELARLVRGEETKPDVPGNATAAPAEENILPLSQCTQPPVVDGHIGKDEYPTCLDGLIEIQEHCRWQKDSGVATALDDRHLYLAAWIELPAGNPPPQTIHAEANIERNPGADLFVLHLQDREAQDDQTVSGPYILIHPDGTVWDAESHLKWNPVSANRNPEVSYRVESVSRYDEQTRRWNVELRIPREVALPGGRAPLMSLGFRYKKAVLSFKDGTVWFDHPSLFFKTAATSLGVRADLSGLQFGAASRPLILGNAGREPIVGEAGLLVADPSISVLATDYNFDDMLGQKLDVQINEIFATWQGEFSVAPGGHASVPVNVAFEQDGLTLVQSRVTADGRDILRRSLPLVRLRPLTVVNRLFPSKSRVESDVYLYKMEANAGRVLRLEAKSTDGIEVLREEFPMPAESGTFTWSMESLPPGDNTLSWSLVDSNTQAVEVSAQQQLEKWPPQPWLEEQVGIDALSADWCPAPWTSLTFKGGIIGLWGRSLHYVPGSLLPMTTSQGREIISRPETIMYKTGADTRSIELEAPRVRLEGRGRARAVQSGASEDFTLKAEQSIEFDGLIWVDMTISPKNGPVNVEGMELSIPLEGLKYVTCQGEIVHGEIHDREFSAETNRAIFFSNDDVGLCWTIESYAGWKIDSTKPRLRLRKADGDSPARFIMNLVNTPAVIEGPMHVRFGLMPTPLKPFRSGSRGERFSSVRQGMKGPTNMVQDRFYWQFSAGSLRPRSIEAVQSQWKARSGQGARGYLYVTTYHSGLTRVVTADAPANPGDPAIDGKKYWLDVIRPEDKNPDTGYFFNEWKSTPLRIGGTRVNLKFVDCSASTSLMNYNLWYARQVLQETDADGYFIDLGEPNYDMDASRGNRVVTLDGKEEGTQEWLAARDFYKRWYWLFEKHRGRKKAPYLLMHGYVTGLVTHSFCDQIMHGEWIKPSGEFTYGNIFQQVELYRPVKGRVNNPDAGVARSPMAPVLRASFPAHAAGIPMTMMAQYDKGAAPEAVRKKLASDPRMARELISLSALSDLRLWAARVNTKTIYDYWQNVEEAFDMADTEFFGYWNNGVKTSDPQVNVSYYKKNGADDYLVLVGNWSDKPVKASVTLPGSLRELGEAVDMEQPGVILPVDPALEVRIPGFDLRALRLKAGGSDKTLR